MNRNKMRSDLLASVMFIRYILCHVQDSRRIDPSRCLLSTRSGLIVTPPSGRWEPSKILFREGATGRGGTGPIRLTVRSAVRAEELPLSAFPPIPSLVGMTAPSVVRVPLSIPPRFGRLKFSFGAYLIRFHAKLPVLFFSFTVLLSGLRISESDEQLGDKPLSGG